MSKKIIHFTVLAIWAAAISLATTKPNCVYAADQSISACGVVFIHHDDGTWSVGDETYSSAYTLEDLKNIYCK